MLCVASLAVLLGSVELRPAGSGDALPPLDAEERYRLVLQGTFEMEATGRRYDARYATGKDGRFTERHGLLRVEPAGAARLAHEDVLAHRYEYEIRAEPGTRLHVELDVARLQEDLLLARPELVAGSTGAIWADLWVDEGWRLPGIGAMGVVTVAILALGLAVIRLRTARKRERPLDPAGSAAAGG